MKTLLKYAIVRFMPFAETEEFANVGIVAWTPNSNWYGYKLVPEIFPRINHFFDDLDGTLFKHAHHYINEELSRIANFANTSQLDSIVTEVTRPREGVMIFGAHGAILTENLNDTLTKLYQTFIGRITAPSKEQRERAMVIELKSRLNELPFDLKYKEKSLNTHFGAVKLPLVATAGTVVKGIKPVSFNQTTPFQLLDHGEKWVTRIRYIIEADSLLPDNFMFVVEAPTSKKTAHRKAYDTVENAMVKLGVHVHQFGDDNRMINFAKFDTDAMRDTFKLN
jgi:hypothetical protein